MDLRRLVARCRRRWAEGSSKPKFPPESPELRGGPLPKLTKQLPRGTPKPEKWFAKTLLTFAYLPHLWLSQERTPLHDSLRFGPIFLICVNDVCETGFVRFGSIASFSPLSNDFWSPSGNVTSPGVVGTSQRCQSATSNSARGWPKTSRLPRV